MGKMIDTVTGASFLGGSVFKGSPLNPAGYIWQQGKKLKPKVPGQTPEELQLQRAQLALIYKQDEDINAKKLRILRGENVNFASLLKSSAPADASGGLAGPPTSGGTSGRQPIRGGGKSIQA